MSKASVNTKGIHPPQLRVSSSKFHRKQLFDAVLENDATGMENVVNSIQQHQDISKLLSEENNMNALNYAIEHGKFVAAKYLIEISNDEMLLNEFIVPEHRTTRTALHQITITNLTKGEVDLAEAILHRVNDKIKALTIETRYDVSSRRQRTFPCLHLASLLGKKQLVKLYLETGEVNGLTVNQRNVKHDTALHWASRYGNSAIVEYLLSNQADPNTGNDISSTPLHWAVKAEKREVIKLLLNDARTDVNSKTSIGLSTPLIIASAKETADIVKLLIANNAVANIQDPSGKTALHLATENGHTNVVKELLKNNGDIDIEDNNGDKAMTIAARKGLSDIVLLLLQMKDDPFTKNHMGHDAWYYAYINDDEELLMVLINHLLAKSKTANPLLAASEKSVLFRAASLGKYKPIKILLDHGVPAETDSEGNSFFHYAAESDQSEVIEKLYKYSDVDIQNKNGTTPFHLAVKLSNVNSIRALMDVTANAAIRDNNGKTVLHFAAKYISDGIMVRELVEYMIKVHSWDDLNAEDEKGNNALHIAAKYGNPDALWELRNISLYAQNKMGNTPFHLSVHVENPHVLEKTLDVFEVMDQKGNINQQNENGETVLHLAVSAGMAHCLSRLLHLNGDLGAMDINGDTPLHHLVKATVNMTDLHHKQKCLQTLDVIIDDSHIWCYNNPVLNNEDANHFSENERALQRCRRQSLTWLIHCLKNKQQLSVLTLSFSIGAHEFLSKILNLDSVKSFSDNDFYYNDVTDIIHLSSGFLEKNYMPSTGKVASANIFGIEMLSHVKDTSHVSKILDIPVIKYMEKVYGKMTRLIFTVLLVLHFLYMGYLSLVGIEISTAFRDENYSFSEEFSSFFRNGKSIFSKEAFRYVGFYLIVPLEPIALLVFSFLSISSESAVHRRNFKKSMIPYYVIYIAFSFTAIVWIVFVSIGERFQDYLLAVCLCGGWLYMIALTHVIRPLHFFWRMLKYMVMKDIILFFIVYLIVLFAFTCAFHVLFQISSSISEMYEHREDTAFLMFTLMLGMGELFDENFTQEMKAVSKNAGLAKILFIGYIVLATIILLNMLIAKMNDTYSKFSSREKSLWRIDSILMGARIERYLPLPLAKVLYRDLGIELMDIPGEGKEVMINGNIVQKYFLKRSKQDCVKKSKRSIWVSIFATIFKNISDENENTVGSLQEQVTKLGIEIDEISKKLDLILKNADRIPRNEDHAEAEKQSL
ncbi:hypothetical protein FSP39_008143 [Pinctada imbricata]|uniref:Ion transport domain-containing protein n=1 Tax=Pinctada imbricata TaxID=66713 RepID=A0AA89C138_PINIB|nr:hypothetical protein FSP39_008143 [Pinctada imbricata]